MGESAEVSTIVASNETEINLRQAEWIRIKEAPGLMIQDIPIPDEIHTELGFPDSVRKFDYVTFAPAESIKDFSDETPTSSLKLEQLRFFTPIENFLLDQEGFRLSVLVEKSLKGDSLRQMREELQRRSATNFLIIDGHGWREAIGDQTVPKWRAPIKDVLDTFDNGDYQVIVMANCQSPDSPINDNKHATLFHPVGLAQVFNKETSTRMVRPPNNTSI